MANSYKSSANDTDPTLRTRRYSRSFDVVYGQFLLMMRQPMKGWSLDERETAQGIARGTFKRLFVHAKVTASIRKKDDGSCEVDVESADAPTGRGGNHRKRVKAFLEQLDDALLGPNPFHQKYY
jgi:hypothetical protein